MASRNDRQPFSVLEAVLIAFGTIDLGVAMVYHPWPLSLVDVGAGVFCLVQGALLAADRRRARIARRRSGQLEQRPITVTLIDRARRSRIR